MAGSGCELCVKTFAFIVIVVDVVRVIFIYHGDEGVTPKQHFYSLSSFCDLAILEFKNVTNNDDEGDLGGFPQVQQHPNKALLAPHDNGTIAVGISENLNFPANFKQVENSVLKQLLDFMCCSGIF